MRIEGAREYAWVDERWSELYSKHVDGTANPSEYDEMLRLEEALNEYEARECFDDEPVSFN